jgi:AmmeMemoRadiSam system protein A
MTPVLLNNEQQQRALRFARECVWQALNPAQPISGLTDPVFDTPLASFVTLSADGQLRGCIGSLEAHRSLADDVAQNAHSAAFRDPRFLPVTMDELPDLSFEISILSKPEALSFTDEQDLFRQVIPHQDGVIIEQGNHRATFLPQVWEQLPDHTTFFNYLKRKAGLDEATPVTELDVQTYQVQCFKEPANQ